MNIYPERNRVFVEKNYYLHILLSFSLYFNDSFVSTVFTVGNT
jgi:hypothetical protein